MAPAHLIILILGALACGSVAARLAVARGRNRIAWIVFTIAVGVALFVVERYVWTRPAGDAAEVGALDMQMFLPIFGMLGAAFIINLLPSLRTDGDDRL